MTSGRAAADVEAAARDAVPIALGVLLRRGTSFGDAEDAMQEALVIAIETWPRSGTPDQPVGWLVRVAQRRLIARHRTDTARSRREALVASWSSRGADPVSSEDDSLALLFRCCHPALRPTSAIPLTLRAVGGLTTREIAEALLMSEATVAQRISRAKATIAALPEPFAPPNPEQLASRLPSVLQVIYLIYTEAHAASSGGTPVRADLGHEAIRLARRLHEQVPDDAEVMGLVALLLLTDARRDARLGPDGAVVPLDEQDRRRWNRPMITEGLRLLTAALVHHRVGEYQLQAAIAAVHDQAVTYADTNWVELRALYNVLASRTDNPLVRLNRAVAIAHTDGPDAALREMTELAAPLADHHRYHATLGYLRDLAGAHDEARRDYATAADLATNDADRAHLRRRSEAREQSLDGSSG